MTRFILLFVLSVLIVGNSFVWAENSFSVNDYEREISLEMQAILKKSGRSIDSSTEISWLEIRKEVLEAQARKEESLYKQTGDRTYHNTMQQLDFEINVIKSMIQKRQKKN